MRKIKKQKRYSKKISVNEYFEMNVSDIWDGIKELQRATKTAILIALVAMLMNLRNIKNLCIKIFQKINKAV